MRNRPRALSRPRQGMIFLTGLLCLGLARTVGPWLDAEYGTPPILTDAPLHDPSAVRAESAPTAPFDAAEQTAARNLLSPTRAPSLTPSPRGVRAGPSAPPAVMITGIVRSGAQQILLLRWPDGHRQRVQMGESVDGWTITALPSGQMSLDRHGVRHVLSQTRRAQAPVNAPESLP